jgi:hypothetical protein
MWVEATLATWLISLVASDPYTHALERIALHEAYDIFWDAWGQEQDGIFKVRRGGIDLTGHGPDGRMTFQEFQDVIQGDARGTCTINPPDYRTRTFDVVAREMVAGLYTGQLNAGFIMGDFSGASEASYMRLLGKISVRLHEAIEKIGLGNALFNDRFEHLEELSHLIVVQRTIEFTPFTKSDIARSPKGDATHPGGFGIPEDRISMAWELIDGSNHEASRTVSWFYTIKDNPDLFKKAEDRDALRRWIMNYGNEMVRREIAPDTPEYTVQARNHYLAIRRWVRLRSRANLLNCI